MEEMVSNGIIEEISVVDVYDLASDIGKECEKIIDSYGPDTVTSLMPKVINALELLEAMASKNEMENTKIQELTDRITYLESEKQQKAIFRDRFQKELEAIEEEWRNESNDLMSMVSRLEEENRRYQKEHHEQQLQQQSPTSPTSMKNTNTKIDMSTSMTASLLITNNETLTSDGGGKNSCGIRVDNVAGGGGVGSSGTSDIYLLQRLRGQIDKHRDELKIKDRELNERISEVENVTIQLERLKQSGRDTRKRQKLLQIQIRSLIDERADFLAQLQDQHREIINLRKRLGIAEKENEDLINSNNNSGAEADGDCDLERARYTTAELKEIFRERDDLRARISDLEEELRLLKPIEVEKCSDMEKNFIGLSKKIRQFKDRYHLNPMMHHGRKQRNRVSENFSENCLPNRTEQRVSLVDHYPLYLRWLSQLVLTATQPSESVNISSVINTSAVAASSFASTSTLLTSIFNSCLNNNSDIGDSMKPFTNYLFDTAGNLDIWFIK